MNQQPPEKQDLQAVTLQVHSIFHTIQGEGPFAGQPAVFVRLAGCNLQCPGCDTNYTTGRIASFSGEVEKMMSMARGDAPTTLAVITGGEPFRQNLGSFVACLLNRGWRVQIETNGTLFQTLPYSEITIVCSPKTGSINKELVPHLNALKYVVDADCVGSDSYPERALMHGTGRLARPPKGFKSPIYFQPFDSGNVEDNKRHQEAAIQSCFDTGNIYSHQLHKLLNLE